MRKIFRTSFVFASLILFVVFGATGETTNGLSQAEIQGRQLAQQLCETRLTRDATNRGVLEIRSRNSPGTDLDLTVKATVREDNYQIDYDVRTNSSGPSLEWLLILIPTNFNDPLIYYSSQHTAGGVASDVMDGTLLRGNQTMIPFAGSDFWICDLSLGLEFFHWPEQRILKHETRRTRACAVLESVNPGPAPGAYSRVESWIDDETSGIVHAEAYDANGKLLKVFDPKSFKKVNGQWELQDMEIRNVQTHSRTWIKFNLHAAR